MNRTLYLCLFNVNCIVFSFDLFCSFVELKLVGENSSATAAPQQQQRNSDSSAFSPRSLSIHFFSSCSYSVIVSTPFDRL